VVHRVSTTSSALRK